MDLLVTGASGFLGEEIVRLARATGRRVAATHHSGAAGNPEVRWVRVDVRRRADVLALVADLRPRIVIHAAAIDRGADMEAVTATGAGWVAEAAAGVRARLVHISSDVVHAGDEDRVYADTDVPRPVSAYGRAKAEAERLVALASPGAAIVRTSLILGGTDRPGKHEQLVLDACDGLAEVRFFDDEVRCPVGAVDLAAAVLAICATDHAGPLNVAGAEALSRADLARLVARAFGRDESRVLTARSVDSPEPRPRLLHLDSARATRLTGVRLRGASELLGLPDPAVPVDAS